MGRSVSFRKGKGDMNHNNRVFYTSNVDPSRTHLNIIYKQEPLTTAYEKLFGEAIQQYNSKQKRNDRKIHDYIDHIRQSKNGEKIFYETIVQIGSKYDSHATTDEGKVAGQLLDEYMKGFLTRNPNLYVFNAVLHMDEDTPHLHIDWIPIGTDYRNGLAVRNSLDKALKLQGDNGISGKKGNSTQAWQNRERSCVIEIMNRNGWEYEEALDTDRGYLSVSQYKAMAEELDHRIKTEHISEIERKPIPFSKDRVSVSAADLDALEKSARLTQLQTRVVDNIRTYTAERFLEVENFTEARKKEVDEHAEAQKTEIDSYALAEKQRLSQEREMLKMARERNERAEERYTAQLSIQLMQERSIQEELQDKKHKLAVSQHQNTELQIEIERLTAENRTLKLQIADFSERIRKITEPLNQQIEVLKNNLVNAYVSLTNIVKAVNMLKYGNNSSYKFEHLTPKQSKLIDSIAKYGISQSKNAGFHNLADDMGKHVGISREIQRYIDPPQQNRTR